MAHGQNPYIAIRGIDLGILPRALYYPATAGVLAMPFILLPALTAATIFSGLGIAVLAYAVTRSAWWPLLAVCSAQAFVAASVGQWSPLLTATVFAPSMLWLAVGKPTLGPALLAYLTFDRATWRQILISTVLAIAVFLVSLAIVPSWPYDLLTTTRTTPAMGIYRLPIAEPLGFVISLALLRWRTGEGRLLLAMACVPQSPFFYDQLPLLLVARTRAELLFLVTASWFSYLVCASTEWHVSSWRELSDFRFPYVMFGLYFPALLLVLFRRRAPSKRLGSSADEPYSITKAPAEASAT